MARVRHTVWQNEEFNPFNHECTNYPIKKGLYAFSTFTYFVEPTIAPLTVTFVAEEENKVGKLLALTPLKPDMGYPLDVEHFTKLDPLICSLCYIPLELVSVVYSSSNTYG